MSDLIGLVDIELNEGINLYEDIYFNCQLWIDAKKILYVLHTYMVKSCEIHGLIDRGARSIGVNPQQKD